MSWNILDRANASSRSVYINFPAIIFFVVLAVLAAGSIHWVHLQQVARHTPLVLEEARKRAAADEVVAALAYYETYLGYRPDDADAIAEHALLKAKIATNANSAADAFYVLLRALTKLPERNDLRRQLVIQGVRIGRIRDCQEEFEVLIRKFPDDLEVLELSARGALQLRDFDVARVRYEKLLELGVKKLEVYREFLQILSSEFQDGDAAGALTAQMIESHPDSVDARVIAGAYYFRRGLLTEADEQISYALNQLHATDPTLFRLQAEIARQRRRPLEYSARLNQLSEQHLGDWQTDFQLAELDLSLGRRHLAEERLLKIARQENATAEQVWSVIAQLSEAQLTGAEQELRERLIQLDPEKKYVPSLMMLDNMRKSDWPAALEISRGLLKNTEVSPRFVMVVSMWRAECYAHVGDVAEQINCYRRALDASPGYQPARSRLAHLLFRAGEFQAAHTEYATLIQQSPVFARDLVTELLEAQLPEAPRPMSTAEVDRLFARWRETALDDPTPVLCQLDFFMRKGNLEQASLLMKEGMEKWPKEIGFRLAQIDNLIRIKAWQDVWTALDDAEAECGLQATLLVRRIFCLEHLDLDSEEKTTRLIACAEQFTKLDRDDQSQVWPLLIRGLQRAGVDPKSVENVLNEYESKNPSDALAHLVSLQNALSADRLEIAREHLESLKTAVGKDSPNFQLASVMYEIKVASKGDSEAISRAKSQLDLLRKSAPQMATQLLLLAADIDLLQQHPQEALAQLQEALRLGDVRSSILIRVTALMVMNGQLEQVVPFWRTLERSESEISENESETPKIEGGLLPGRRDLASLRTAIAPAAKDSWAIALALFRVDLALNAAEPAGEMIQLALKSSPQTALIWANWLPYVERFQPKTLNQELQEAKQKLTIAEQARLLPSILLRQRRADEAASLLKSACEESPHDAAIFRTRIQLLRQRPGEENLAAILKNAMSTTDAESASVREAARREFALWESTSKDYRKYREAVALADQIVRESAPDDDDAWRVQAEVNAHHSAHWKVAVAAFRHLEQSTHPEIRADAYLREARLLEQHRRWDEQDAALKSLLQLQPDQPQVVAQLMMNAVRRKDTKSVDHYYAVLSRLAKDDRLRLLSEVMLAASTGDRADIVPRVQAAYDQKTIPLDLTIEWLSLLKDDETCDAILKSQVDKEKPETIARYSIFLSTHKRALEAIPYLSLLWKSGAREFASMVALSILNSPEVKPTDLEALRLSLLKLSQLEDTSLPLLTTAAALEDHAAHPAAAMGLYRLVLQRSPDNLLALNNLSFLEAIHADTVGDATLQRIRHALDLHGPIDQLIDSEGVILLRRGEAQAALERFQQAWEQQPETNYLVHQAWAFMELKQRDAAAELYRRVDAADSPPHLHPLEAKLDIAYRSQLFDNAPADASTPAN